MSENDLFSRLIYTPLMRVLPSAQYWKILILNFFSQKYKNNIFHKNVAPPAEMISLTNRDPILHFFGSRCIAFDNYKLCRSLCKCLYFIPYENSMYSMYVLCVTFKAIYKTDQHISLTALCKISYNKQTGTIQYNLVILQANAVQEI